MFIKNLPELIKSKKINDKNYYICENNIASLLLEKGFAEISQDEKGNHYFFKTRELTTFLRKEEVL